MRLIGEVWNFLQGGGVFGRKQPIMAFLKFHGIHIFDD